MIYADTDFFLALLKQSDWLSKKAEELLRKYKNDIWTSTWTLVEILLISKEYGLDPEKVVLSIKELVKIEGDLDSILVAAHLMKEKNMNTFDALHAASSGSSQIISSDKIFDSVGLDRIKLEK